VGGKKVRGSRKERTHPRCGRRQEELVFEGREFCTVLLGAVNILESVDVELMQQLLKPLVLLAEHVSLFVQSLILDLKRERA
jgi:hypothetical protein